MIRRPPRSTLDRSSAASDVYKRQELEHSPKHPAVPLRKLVLSAISNWKQKNEGGDESQLVVKTIFVDGARTLKRMQPAPQGRGYRVRKRSNHVTVIVDTKESKN